MDQFLCDRLTRLEKRIILLEDVLEKLDNSEAGTIVTYSFDDGQTKEAVTRRNITTLENTLATMLSRRDILRQRCGKDTGVVQVAPTR